MVIKKYFLVLFTLISFSVNAQLFITQNIDTNTKYYCLNQTENVTPLSILNVSGNFTYKWYSNNVRSYNGATLVISTDVIYFTPPTNIKNIKYYFVVIENELEFKDTSWITGKIITDPDITFYKNVSTIDTSFCKNSTNHYLAYKSNYPYLNYIWIQADNKEYLNQNINTTTLNINSDSLLIPTNINSVYCYKAVATDNKCNKGNFISNISGFQKILSPLIADTNFNANFYDSNISICYKDLGTYKLKANLNFDDPISPVNFQWSFKNLSLPGSPDTLITNNGNISSLNINTNKIGSYKYTVTSQNVCNQIVQTYNSIKILPIPVIGNLTTNSSLQYCYNENTTDKFTIENSQKASGINNRLLYTWYDNKKLKISDTNFTLINTNNRGCNTYTFYLKQENYACFDSLKKDFVAGICITSIAKTVNNTYNFCQYGSSDNIVLTCKGKGVENFQYQWYYIQNGDTNDIALKTTIENANGLTYSIPTADSFSNKTYFVKVTQDANAGCAINNIDSVFSFVKNKVNVNLKPIISFVEYSMLDTTYCTNYLNPLKLKIQSNIPNLNYNWYFSTTKQKNNLTTYQLLQPDNIDPFTKDTGTYNYLAIGFKTYSAVNCFDTTEFSGKIIIKPLPVFKFNPNEINFCYGDSLNLYSKTNYTIKLPDINSFVKNYTWNEKSLVTYQNNLLSNENTEVLGLKKILTEDVQYKLSIELSNNCIGSDSVKITVLKKPSFTSYSSNYFIRNQFCKNDTTNNISYILDNYSELNFKSLLLYKSIDSNIINPTLVNTIDKFTSIKIPTNDTGSYYLFGKIFTINGCSEFSNISSLQTVFPTSEAILNMDSNRFVCINQSPKSPLYLTNINKLKDQVSWFTFDDSDKIIHQINTNEFSYLPEPSISVRKNYYYVITNNEYNCTFKSNIDSIFWENSIKINTINFNDTFYCNNEYSRELIINTDININRLKIQWYRSLSLDGDNPILIQGATDTSFYPITKRYLLNADTNYYFALINDKLNACPFQVSPISGKIILKYPSFKINPSTNTFKNCYLSNKFSTLNVDINYSPEWEPLFSWYKSNTNSYKNGVLISPESPENYFKPKTDKIDTSYYFAVVRQTGSSCNNITDTSKISGPFITYPVPTISLNFLDSVVCINSTNTFIEVSSNYNWQDRLIYKWYKSNYKSYIFSNNLMNENTKSIFPTTNEVNTSYYFSIVENSIGCIDTSKIVTLITNNLPIITYFKIDTNYCLNAITNYIKINTSSVQAPYKVRWFLNNNLIQNANTDSILPKSDKLGLFTYYALVTDKFNCINIKDELQNIHVNNLPKIKINTLGKDSSVILGETYSVSGTGGVNYFWNPYDLFSLKVTHYDSVTLFKTISDTTIYLKGEDNNGCFNYDTLKIQVKSKTSNLLKPSNIITNNNDGINDFWNIENIDNFDENEINIYSEKNHILVRNLKNYKNLYKWNGTDQYGFDLFNGVYFFEIRLYKNGVFFYNQFGYFIILK